VPAARQARSLGFNNIEVYTNGLALKGQLFRDLADLDVTFAFSVYGQDPLVHDAVTRVPGSHRRTLEAIERSTAADLNVRVGIIDTGKTGFNLEATREIVVGLGVSPGSIGADVQREVGRGVFQQPATSDNRENTGKPQPPALSPRDLVESFAGAAAVAYNGEVYPCIFSRDLAAGGQPPQYRRHHRHCR